MNSTDREGLGLSVLVYLGAIFGALVLLATPLYYATRGEVHAIPPLAQADPLLNVSLTGDRNATRYPLANLQRQSLIDAETTAFLKPKTKKAEAPPRAAARTARRDAGTPMAELQTERRAGTAFPFSLF